MFARACLRQVNATFTSVARAAASPSRTTTTVLPALHRQWRWAVQPATAALFSSSSVARAWEERSNSRDRPKNPPSNTLFLGNLPYSVSDEELKNAFSQLAPVKEVRAAITKDGVHKGWAHIEFHSIGDAKRVYESDQEDPIFILGRNVVIDYAVSRTPGGNTARRRAPKTDMPCRTLYFWGFEGSEEDVHTTLKEYAKDIQAVRFLLDRTTMKPYGSGLIDFPSDEIASKVLEAMDSVESAHNGKTIKLAFSKNPGSASMIMRRKNHDRLTSEAEHREKQEKEWHDRVVGGRQAPSESE